MTIRQFEQALSLKQKFNADVLWNVGSLAILAVSGIVMNLLIARFHGSDALGMFNQVFACYIVLSQFAVGGLQFSVLKHVSHHQDDPEQCAEFVSAACVLIGVLAVTIAGLTFWGAPLVGQILQSPGVALGLRLIAPGLVLFALNKALLMALNGMRHMRAFAIFQALRYLFLILTISVLTLLKYPAHALAFAFTVSEFLLFCGLFAYVNLRLFHLSVSRKLCGRFAPHLSFGMRGVMSGVLSEINTRVDILLLGYFLPDSAVGMYSFSAMWAEGVAQLSLVLRQNIDPILGRHFAQGTTEQIPVIAKKVRMVFYPMMAAIGAIAMAGYPLMLELLTTDPNFREGWGIFGILLAGIVINAGYRPFQGIFLQGGRPGAHTIFVTVLVFANIVLNLLLIPSLGIWGSAIATSSVCIFEGMLLVVMTRQLFNISL